MTPRKVKEVHVLIFNKLSNNDETESTKFCYCYVAADNLKQTEACPEVTAPPAQML